MDGADAFGGVTPLDAMVRHLHGTAGVPLVDAIAMATDVPARVLGLDHRNGQASVADLVVAVGLDVTATYLAGRLVHGAAGPYGWPVPPL